MLTATRATRREDLTTMALAAWLMIGLLIDAYFHSTDPSLETFWTPWHAVFYSGYLATSLWIVRMTVVRRRPEGGALSWAPAGYRLALIGLGVFAAGGVGDALWHSALGVETGLDALLSPTHLLLFIGALLIVSAPVRAAWSDDTMSRRPLMGEFVAPLLSMIFTTALVAFFFEYLWLPANDWAPGVQFNPRGNGQLPAILGVAGAVISSVILMTGPVLTSRRWRLPPGSITLHFLLVNTFVTYAFDASPVGMVPVILGGAVADIAVAFDLGRRFLAIAPTATMLLGYYFMVGRQGTPLRWPPEVWGGSVVLAVLAVVAVDQIIEAGRRLGPGSPFSEELRRPKE